MYVYWRWSGLSQLNFHYNFTFQLSLVLAKAKGGLLAASHQVIDHSLIDVLGEIEDIGQALFLVWVYTLSHTTKTTIVKFVIVCPELINVLRPKSEALFAYRVLMNLLCNTITSTRFVHLIFIRFAFLLQIVSATVFIFQQETMLFIIIFTYFTLPLDRVCLPPPSIDLFIYFRLSVRF